MERAKIARRRGRLEEWAIAAALVALAIVGALTVFDDEIAQLRGRPVGAEAAEPGAPGAAPITPGNTQGTL